MYLFVLVVLTKTGIMNYDCLFDIPAWVDYRPRLPFLLNLFPFVRRHLEIFLQSLIDFGILGNWSVILR